MQEASMKVLKSFRNLSFIETQIWKNILDWFTNFFNSFKSMINLSLNGQNSIFGKLTTQNIDFEKCFVKLFLLLFSYFVLRSFRLLIEKQ